MHDLDAGEPRLRIGSLFSGYGGLDLAVEHVFNATTAWFSELNAPVARVFTHHWPYAANLGDITTIDWSRVEPVDILIGGFPCQDVSTVGKRAGLAPGTRSGLWAHMTAAIDALQPEWVVIENVRGLLSSPATRPPAEGDDHDRSHPGDATSNGATLRSVEPDRGIWETTQLDLYGLSAPFSAIWPTCGWMHDGSAYRLPLSALLTNVSASSPSPGALFRTPLATDSSRGGKPSTRCERDAGADAIARWEHITGRPAPAPALLNDADDPRPAPAFVEWLMGLPTGWVTDADELTQNQQITALGNGVLPLQAVSALSLLAA